MPCTCEAIIIEINMCRVLFLATEQEVYFCKVCINCLLKKWNKTIIKHWKNENHIYLKEYKELSNLHPEIKGVFFKSVITKMPVIGLFCQRTLMIWSNDLKITTHYLRVSITSLTFTCNLIISILVVKKTRHYYCCFQCFLLRQSSTFIFVVPR